MEALLVNRVEPARDYYIGPDRPMLRACRPDSRKLEGISGGEDVWRKINGFFGRLKERSRPLETGTRYA